MSIIHFGDYIKILRDRKALTQYSIATDYHNVTQSRWESGTHLPRKIEYNYFEDQPMNIIAMRWDLIRALDKNAVARTSELLNEMERFPNMDAPVNKQFIFSQKARLWEQEDKPPNNILELIIEALAQTFHMPDTSIPGTTPLLYEEPELFHTLARMRAKNGNLNEAIRVLQSLETNLSLLPAWDKDKERQSVPVLLSLTRVLQQAGNYNEAEAAGQRGIDLSATRRQGLHIPDFLYLQAQARYAQNVDCTHQLRCAYFCYTLLNKIEAAEELRRIARIKMKVDIDTYGVEKLTHTVPSHSIQNRDDIQECKTLGELLRTLRENAGLSLQAIAEGICSYKVLSKIERDDIQGKMQYIIPLMQRLGRDAFIYFPFPLRKDDFINMQIKEKIHMLQTRGDYKKAAQLVDFLRDKKDFKTRTNLQFIKRVDALYFNEENPDAHEEYINRLLEALHITCPQFNERDIERYPLTHDEIILINALAGHYLTMGDYERSANIFERLINNLRHMYVDKSEQARMYTTVLFNYSTCLGRANQINKAMRLIEEGLEVDQEWGCLFGLSELTFNKAYNLFKLGEEEKSVPYFMQAYYGVTTLLQYGFKQHQKIARDFIKEHFGINLD